MPLELGERHAGGGKIATFPIVFTNDSKCVPRIANEPFFFGPVEPIQNPLPGSLFVHPSSRIGHLRQEFDRFYSILTMVASDTSSVHAETW